MTKQKINDFTAKIIAFANTDGGTLILGLGEDSATKKAVAPIQPLPRCKDAANSLFQSINSRVEPYRSGEGRLARSDGG